MAGGGRLVLGAQSCEVAGGPVKEKVRRSISWAGTAGIYGVDSSRSCIIECFSNGCFGGVVVLEVYVWIGTLTVRAWGCSSCSSLGGPILEVRFVRLSGLW